MFIRGEKMQNGNGTVFLVLFICVSHGKKVANPKKC
jgi:hypothetical protein